MNAEVTVDGIYLTVPAIADIAPKTTTAPYSCVYNYLPLVIVPHTILPNGICYGTALPDALVTLDRNGGVSADGKKRKEDPPACLSSFGQY